jgi:type II secretory pathway component PulF
LILYAYFVSSDEKLRGAVDKFLLRVPGLKDALIHSATSATFMIASSILRGGGSFLLAADIASRGTRLNTVREYWRSTIARVYNGEHIATALIHPLVTGSERIILVSHTDRTQLGTAFGSIATSRDSQAAASAKKFSFLIFFASLVYSGSAVLVTLWVVYLQNQQMMAAAKIL